MAYQRNLWGIVCWKQSEKAFNKAGEGAKQKDAKLYLLSVINGERMPSGGPNGFGFVDRSVYKPAVETMKEKLAEYQQKAKQVGVKEVTMEVEVGNAKVELAESYPAKNDIDLIVIGATGLNVVGRLIVGSTASYTIREAPCDVTVVKTDQNNKRVDLKKNSYPEI